MGKYSDMLLGAKLSPTSETSVPLSSDVTISSEQPASFSTIARASFANTVPGQVAIFAQSRFPNEPLERALSRYGIQDNRIFYVDDDGRQYFENIPLSNIGQQPTVAGKVGSALREIPETLASATGPILQSAAAIPAALIGSPLIGVPTAAVLSGGAELGKQKLGQQFGSGENINPLSVAIETGLGAGGQAVGDLASMAINRGRFATDVNQLKGPAPEGAITDPSMSMTRGDLSQRIAQGSEKFDVPTTMAEQTRLPSLVTRQKVLMSRPEAAELLDEFYEIRNDKVRDALYKQFDIISPMTDASAARVTGARGADLVIESEKQALRLQAKPLYQEAEQVTGIDIKPLIDEVNEMMLTAKSTLKGPLTKALKDLQVDVPVSFKGGKVQTKKVADNSLIGLDKAQKSIFDSIQKLKASNKPNAARDLSLIHKNLIDILENSSDAYKQARAIYAEDMPKITALTDSQVGQAAKLGQKGKEINITNVMFNPRTSDGATVKAARDAFVKAGQVDKYNGILRSYLQETLENIPTLQSGKKPNIGSYFRNKLAGTKNSANILKEALGGGDSLKDFFWLLDTLNATGIATGKESITAFAQAAQKDIQREGSGVVGPLIESLEFWRSPSRVAGYIKGVNADKYAARLAEILTTKTGRDALKEVSKLKPRSRASIVALSGLLVQSGFEGAVAAINNRSMDYSAAMMGPELVNPNQQRRSYSDRLLGIN